MAHSEDILIIGGGVVGVCAAYYLRERGHSVTIVEKGDIASGSSYGNAGLIVPSHILPIAAPGVARQGLKWLVNPESPLYIKPRFSLALMRWMWRFLRNCREAPMQQTIAVLTALNTLGADLHQELAAIEGMDFGYECRGGLYIYNTAAGYKKGVKEGRLLESLGLEVQVLEGLDAVRGLEQVVGDSIVGGLYLPNDTHLIPDRFVRQMANLVAKRGVTIQTNTEVLDIAVSGQQISRVATTKGDFIPGQVVLATGAWSPALTQKLGFPLLIQPAKGYSITIKRPPTSPSIPMHFSERKVIVTPMGDQLRFAGTLELAGLNLSINQRRLNAIEKAARAYLPDLGQFEVVEIWRGMRPLTPDTMPVIGRTKRIPNFVLATGHGMLGMSQAPVTGKLVASIIDGDPLDDKLNLLGIERF